MEVRILKNRRSNKSRVASELEAKHKNDTGTIYVSDCQSKPKGVWKLISSREEIKNGGTYFVKTATWWGCGEVWEKIGESEKVVLDKSILWK